MLRTTLNQLPLSRPYLVVTAVAILLFLPTWYRLLLEWLKWEQVLAHGLPTFVIYLGLLLIHPPRTPDSQHHFSKTGGILLLGTVLIWGLLELVRIDTLAYLMLPAGVAATAWTLLGLPAALRLLPYILLLGLSLPIWADIVPLLVHIASVVVGEVVRWFGMTALIEGSSITLPYGRLVIADGCSGIRYFAISILLAMMMSILNDYRWKGWLALLASAMMLGLMANWVRIFILVVVGYQSEMQSDLLYDHETMGWIVYAAFILPALFLAPAVKRSAAAEQQPVHLLRAGFVFAGAALLLGPVAINAAQLTGSEKPAWALTESNLQAATVSGLPLTMRLPAAMQHEVWQTPEGVWISLAQSRRSDTDNKLVPYMRPPVDREEWILTDTQGNIRIYRHLLNRQQVAMIQWYQVGNYRASNYRDAKLLQIPATLTGETRFALVTLMLSCGQRACDENALQAMTQQKTAIQLNSR
ncbi:MAG: exosortase/archaeosortase family protein [Marinobacter sp.]|nr:exosortase/archaeosortase family protein [Marinobacter sp.]